MSALSFGTQIETHVVWDVISCKEVQDKLKLGWHVANQFSKNTAEHYTVITVLVRVINRTQGGLPDPVVLTPT